MTRRCSCTTSTTVYMARSTASSSTMLMSRLQFPRWVSIASRCFFDLLLLDNLCATKVCNDHCLPPNSLRNTWDSPCTSAAYGDLLAMVWIASSRNASCPDWRLATGWSSRIWEPTPWVLPPALMACQSPGASTSWRSPSGKLIFFVCFFFALLVMHIFHPFSMF